MDIFLSRLKEYGVDPPTMAWKRVATEQQCMALFQESGLRNVRSTRIDHGYYLNDASDWWHIVWNGGFRGLVSRLPDTDRARFKEEHLDEVAACATDNGLRLEMKVLYTVGTKMP